jgi:ketosteroid isomerase-like protein
VSADDNIKTIQGMYEAFGRGDVATILAGLAEDVDWAAEAAGTAAPWWGPRHGHAEVVDFFQAFGATIEVEEFTPTSFAGSGDEVFSLVRCVGTARATGRGFAMDLHHYFRFDEDGKVAYYRGTEDTAQVEAALA